MAVLLSLQGGMAVGKTTVARRIESALPQIYVDYEDPIPVWKEVERRGLFENTLDNFITRQRMFIAHELQRRKNALARTGVTLFDLGIEEIEFFTLFYPKSLGFDWDIETLMADDLREIRAVKPDGILFLDAKSQTLTGRRQYDSEKKRGFFDHFIEKMADDKRNWFKTHKNAEFFDTDGLAKEEAYESILNRVKTYL